MKPSSFSWLLSANSTASQRYVTSVPPCWAMSSTVRTLVARSTARPPKATAVRFRFKVPAMTQPVTMSAKDTATIHSSRLRGPIERSAARAAAGASGEAVTPGGYNRYRNQGKQQDRGQRRNRRGDEPRAEVDRRGRTASATDTPIGLTEVAVSQRAEETARLAIPQNIR